MTNRNFLTGFLAIGILIKFLLMAFSFHGDLAFIWAIPSTVEVKDIFTFYKDYSLKYPEFYQSVSTVYYPPLSLAFVILILPVLRIFSSSLQPWLANLQQMLFSGQATSGKELYINSIHPGTLFDLWLLKLPYFFFDIAVALTVWNLSGEKIKNKMLMFWWFNPINLYATYMMGQIDIVIVFFLVDAVLLVKKNNLVAPISALMALMIKTYALAILPAFYLIQQTYKQLVVLAAVMAAVVFMGIFPFAMVDQPSITAAFFPKIMAAPFSCGFRPDTVWSCGKLLTAVIVLFFCLWTVLKNRFLV